MSSATCDALHDLVEMLPALRRYASRLLYDQADDLVQSCCVRILYARPPRLTLLYCQRVIYSEFVRFIKMHERTRKAAQEMSDMLRAGLSWHQMCDRREHLWAERVTAAILARQAKAGSASDRNARKAHYRRGWRQRRRAAGLKVV